jgi:glucose/arabinose dehydrogenase
MELLHEEVTETPAPTAMPLPTATPWPMTGTTVAQPTSRPEPTSEPPTEEPTATTAPVSTTPAAVVAPTRVVPPRDVVNLPPGFGISVFAEGLSGPRMMTTGPDSQVYVAERGAGRIIRLPDKDGDAVADGVEVVADGLNRPSSIDFYKDGSLTVGETRRILQLRDPDGDGTFQEQEVIIDGLPGEGHSTRTVLFSPDWAHLFVSIGSSCNVCFEEDERRAAIMRYQPDGSAGEVYAKGLRNAVGIAFRPGTGELWTTNNGRDWLGDDQPPETVYVVDQGDDAGWPRCHSGRIVDPDYGQPGACEAVDDPVIEMQAHSAPLGLTFYSGEQFPEAYRGDLFIAFHGSWNRTVPTGYKVVRVPMDGDEPGSVEDFATGWLREDGSRWGRPVDVLTAPDGSLLISDDSEGFIYRVFYAGE